MDTAYGELENISLCPRTILENLNENDEWGIFVLKWYKLFKFKEFEPILNKLKGGIGKC
jgi:hypothetical protein